MIHKQEKAVEWLELDLKLMKSLMGHNGPPINGGEEVHHFPEETMVKSFMIGDHGVSKILLFVKQKDLKVINHTPSTFKSVEILWVYVGERR